MGVGEGDGSHKNARTIRVLFDLSFKVIEHAMMPVLLQREEFTSECHFEQNFIRTTTRIDTTQFMSKFVLNKQHVSLKSINPVY